MVVSRSSDAFHIDEKMCLCRGALEAVKEGAEFSVKLGIKGIFDLYA